MAVLHRLASDTPTRRAVRRVEGRRRWCGHVPGCARKRVCQQGGAQGGGRRVARRRDGGGGGARVAAAARASAICRSRRRLCRKNSTAPGTRADDEGRSTLPAPSTAGSIWDMSWTDMHGTPPTPRPSTSSSPGTRAYMMAPFRELRPAARLGYEQGDVHGADVATSAPSTNRSSGIRAPVRRWNTRSRRMPSTRSSPGIRA